MSKSRVLPSWMLPNQDVTADAEHEQTEQVNDRQRKDFSEISAKKIERVLPSSLVDFQEYNLQYLKFPGRIFFTNLKDECNFICHDLIESSSRGTAVGFDIEWRVSHQAGQAQRPTALIQICNSENKCYLFHIATMFGFPTELRRLLETEHILKAGVGIKGDMSKLQIDFNVNAVGTADLSTIANKLQNVKENWSLNGLTIKLLKKKLAKERKIRCGDWERYPLSKEQLEYAAIDAYASWRLYVELASLSQAPKSIESFEGTD